MLHANSDPVLLMAEIRAAQEELGRRVDHRGLNGAQSAPIVVDLDRFTTGQKTAWRDGEQRPTHRRPYRRRKPVPHRASMVDEQEAQICAWLDAEPHLSAQVVLLRLIDAAPDQFNERQLRIVQRAVKVWRTQSAHRIILGGFTTLLGPSAATADTTSCLPAPV
jgi:hypothetical protein